MTRIGRTERRVLVLGLGLFVLSCLYLPVEFKACNPNTGICGDWRQSGWSWITELGRQDLLFLRVDLMRLVLEWLAIAALLAIARLTLPRLGSEP